MSDFSKLDFGLSDKKRALLEAMLKEEGIASASTTNIPRRERADRLPLSFAQQRLWFLDQLMPGNPFYNMPAAVRLSGPLDLRAMQQSLNEVVARHEVLRTRFEIEGGEPVQVIEREQEVRIWVADVSQMREQQREQELKRIASQEAELGFDLMRGPMLRVGVVRMSEQEHALVVVMHHIVSDAWSLQVLIKEVTQLYEWRSRGEERELEEMEIQYGDYAEWERKRLRAEALEEQMRYWREKLEGVEELRLPADRARPAVQRHRGSSVVREMRSELRRKVKEMSRAEGMTIFMVMLAGFKALMSRYSGQEDIVVGTPVGGRERAELEGLIGFFVNTLVMRTEVRGEESFRELMSKVKEVALGAYAHQEVPFEKIVEELQPERSLSHSPIFQVVFNFINVSKGDAGLSGLSLDIVDVDPGTSRFDLTLRVFDDGKSIYPGILYNTDLFDEATIERMLDHFLALLESAVADPDQRISDLQFLTKAEREQLLARANNDRRDYPVEACLHRQFEAQAEKTPEATALVYELQRLTYRELNRRANQLARHLQSLGAGPEVKIGICVERSLEMIVGLLAVLKAGAAYLPLDPAHPKERLAFMLEDSQVPVVLTQQNLIERLPLDSASLVPLDTQWDIIAAQSDRNPTSDLSTGNLAYVIYTSGSTGMPKGVLVTHFNVARLFEATREWFRFDERDVWTMFHSYAFDFSVWEMWGALLYGGRLVVVPYIVSRSPDLFYEMLGREKVTVLNQTPSAFRQLIAAQEASGDEASSLRLVIFGGEALELESLRGWFDRRGDRTPQLVNMYGITETTVHVTYRPLTMDDLCGGRGSVIGEPIPDLQAYILDRHLQLVPFGAAGEIYVGGAGVARGYLNRPDLTAERFIPNPFATDPGARLYKTGDLARARASGDVEYLGRKDHQVKVRGFRIELGEIEAAIAAYPSVSECVVLMREDEPGDRRLVAYVVNRQGEEITVEQMQKHLRRRLPEYMIPAWYVNLEQMPLTVNGKADRKRLPEPGQQRPEVGNEYEAGRDELERLLAKMWAEMLGIEKVGIQDDFFSLGGNSISAAIFINKLQERLGEIVHVVAIFNAPTIAELAAYLSEHYAGAVSRICGQGAAASGERVKIDSSRVERIRELIKPLPPRKESRAKNPPAIFVLSAPRSGSTLFRVMLGGHPLLFAPPELELLSFNTLEQRRAAFAGPDSFWLEGAIRALMEIKSCDAQRAKAIMKDFEDRKLTTQRFYRRMQEWIGEKRLVDKTPSYALDPEILKRAEADFDAPLYIHLLRHPLAMIRSFEEARLDQIFFRYPHSFSRRELAALIWLISNENILEFFKQIPPHRQHRVRFEELVSQPEAVLKGVCRFLGLDLHADMLQPYKDKQKRMTDGIYAESRMLGDVKFHTYSGIDSRAGARWKEFASGDDFGDQLWRLAETFGYERAGNASGESEARKAIAPIGRASREASREAPLSFAQQRLWFLDQLQPGHSLYNIPAALHLDGRLNVEALERALNEIIRRHESLRTTFTAIDGEPAQVIAQAQPLALTVTRLEEKSPAEREALALRLATEEAERPFDLQSGPLLRASLLRLSETEHALLVTMHHIISDGWSMRVLIQEAISLYEAFLAGKPSPLADLPIQYADYAEWQREWLQGEALKEQIDYWKRQLGGKMPLLELPLDRARPPVQTYRGAIRGRVMPRALIESLKRLGQREGLTTFMTMLSGFKALLYRYSGQRDIAVGTPIAGRNRAELEGLIGFFVNTLVMKTDVRGEESFRELMRRVREVALGAYRNQEAPFEKIVDELQPERSLSHTPLFQAMFILQESQGVAVELEGLSLSALETETSTAKFDLSFVVSNVGAETVAAIEYNTDLFDEATIDRMLSHFEKLIEGATAFPDERLSAISLLDDAERRQLLVEWNDTRADYPAELCLHNLFESQAKRTPEATAVIFEDQRLTYAELNRRANNLARHLQAMGVKPETRVGICARRGAEMVVALLAALKAGGAYVPLDPLYPKERLAFMLKDANVAAIVTERDLIDHLPKIDASVALLDSDRRALASHDDDPASATTPGNLAYIIYTSGSTGDPKGAAIEHRNAVAFLRWAATEFDASDLAGVLASTSICFDLSVFELFAPLSVGGKVIVAENALQLPALRAAGEVTLVNTVPSAMAELVSGDALLGSVRTVNLAGEPLKNHLAQQIYRQENILRVFNLYGPTEDTTYSTFAQIERGASNQPSIGRPISNSQAYILDPLQRPVPIGIAGELCIGGAGLARGYLNRPELTAEKFIPNPFAVEPGARLYRTGDLARYLRDGNIEFLGRIDHQVKVRGFRIEPGEIEAALCRHPRIKEAVVVAREDAPEDHKLVAYIVGERPLPDGVELRGYLREKLPDYMIPSFFITLDAMPLTPNKKVDRRALPSPDPASLGLREAFVAARDVMELQLAQVWQEVLGVRRVGVKDDFFSLGGHSLLAIRLMARIQQLFKKSFPLTVLFQNPTIEHLANALRGQVEPARWSPLVAIQKSGAKRPFFCVHPAGGNVFCYAELSRYLGADQPFYAFRAPGLDGEQAICTRVEELASVYIAAMREAEPRGPYLLGGWSFGGIVAFEMARQLRAEGERVSLLVLMDSRIPNRYEAAVEEGEEKDLALVISFGLNLGLPFEQQEISLEQFSRLNPDERFDYVIEQARIANLLPPYVELAHVRRLFEVFKANVAAASKYDPQSGVERIVLLKATERPANASQDATLGWEGLADEAVNVFDVAGDHFTMVREPNVQSLAELLKACIDEAEP